MTVPKSNPLSVHPNTSGIVLPFLVDAIKFTHQVSAGRWGLTDYRPGARLNAGFTEVLTLNPDHVRLVVDSRRLPRRRSFEIERGSGGRAYYPSIPRSVCVTVPFAPLRALESTLRSLLPAFHDAVSRAGGRGLGKGVVEGHSKELVEEIARSTGEMVPQPRYVASIRRPEKPDEEGLVNAWIQIRANLARLHSYRKSSNAEAQGFFRQSIARGRCFVVCKVDGKALFGPSRFVGYQANSRSKHLANDAKDGRVTNKRLESIMGDKFVGSQRLETQFLAFCSKYGIEPKDQQRKFMNYDAPIFESEFDRLAADLEEIESVQSTDKEQLITARLGQGRYRARVTRLWGGRCVVTGLATSDLLRASHIKPWRHANNQERLDPLNGLLLTATLDAAFDRGLISFSNAGRLLISRRLSERDRSILGIRGDELLPLKSGHEKYLEYHRRKVFR